MCASIIHTRTKNRNKNNDDEKKKKQKKEKKKEILQSDSFLLRTKHKIFFKKTKIKVNNLSLKLSINYKAVIGDSFIEKIWSTIMVVAEHGFADFDHFVQ